MPLSASLYSSTSSCSSSSTLLATDSGDLWTSPQTFSETQATSLYYCAYVTDSALPTNQNAFTGSVYVQVTTTSTTTSSTSTTTSTILYISTCSLTGTPTYCIASGCSGGACIYDPNNGSDTICSGSYSCPSSQLSTCNLIPAPCQYDLSLLWDCAGSVPAGSGCGTTWLSCAAGDTLYTPPAATCSIFWGCGDGGCTSV